MDPKRGSVNLPSTPTIFSDVDLEQKFDSVLYYWYRKFPQEAKDLLEAVKKVRQHLHDPKGFSAERLMLLKAMLPPRVVYALGPSNKALHGLPKNWMDNIKYMKKFLQCCDAFCLNHTSVPDLSSLSDRKDMECDFDYDEADRYGVDNRP